MSGIAATLTLDGLPALREQLQDLIELGEDLTPLMEAWGGAMADSTTRRFDTETEPGGMKWVPSQRAKAVGGQTLSDTGRLKQSFDSPATVIAERLSVEWGTNTVYAAIHQFGFDDLVVVNAHNRKQSHVFGRELAEAMDVHVPSFVKRMFMTPRPFVGVDADDLVTLEEIGANFIEQMGATP